MGITQKAFEITLQQLQIPYIPNDSTIDWRPNRYELEDPLDKTTKFSYDFYIPFLGKIDVKSATLKKPYVNINCREFNRENPDFVVAYQILNLNKPKWLKLVGFLRNSEVREYDTRRKGTWREYWPIPVEDIEAKHNGKELCLRLLLAKAILKELERRPLHELI